MVDISKLGCTITMSQDLASGALQSPPAMAFRRICDLTSRKASRDEACRACPRTRHDPTSIRLPSPSSLPNSGAKAAGPTPNLTILFAFDTHHLPPSVSRASFIFHRASLSSTSNATPLVHNARKCCNITAFDRHPSHSPTSVKKVGPSCIVISRHASVRLLYHLLHAVRLRT